MQDAIDKLKVMILECSRPDKKEFVIPPPTENMVKNRIESKRHKSSIKKLRQNQY